MTIRRTIRSSAKRAAADIDTAAHLGESTRVHLEPRSVLLWIGVAALAVNLRLGVAAIPPILPELKSGFGLTTTTESLLAAVPVICFGIVSVAAAPATRRFGEERVVGIAMAGIALGIGLRAMWPGSLLFAGTIVMAGSIALVNVLLASLIKRRDPRRAGPLIGLYLVCLSGGATAASALTIPLFDATHSSFHAALGIWALPAVAAFLIWIPQLRYRTMLQGIKRQRLGLIHQPLAWQVTAFMGLQSTCYYSVVSWLPTMLRHREMSPTGAGVVVAMLSIGSMVGAFGAPTFASRREDHRSLIAPVMLISLAGVLGLVFAPTSLAVPIALVLGAGQGAVLALALLFVIARSPNASAAASLSGMAQGVGYTFAAGGPLLVGVVHARSSSWPVAFGVVEVLTVLQWIAAWLAARPLTLDISDHEAR